MDYGRTESYDNTIIRSPADPPIIDADGVVYRLEEGGTVTLNDIEDRTIHDVVKLAYVQRMVWALDLNNHWYSRYGSREDWSSPTDVSPLLSDQFASIRQLVAEMDMRSAVLTEKVSKLTETLNLTSMHVTAIRRLTVQILVRNAREGEQIMATLADIENAVRNEKTVEDSMVVLLQSIAGQLQAAIASNDPARIQAIVDQLNTNTQTMTEAVLANTQQPPPAPPPEPPAPPVEPPPAPPEEPSA